MAKTFYVYEHWRPDRGECFYVGKGHGNRATNMKQSRNRHHKAIQAKLSRMGFTVEVRIVAGNLGEEAAFALEKERIALWRADGADLANRTDGGDGVSGYRWDEGLRERMRARMIERYKDPAERARTSELSKGHRLSQETKDKLRIAHTGKKMSPEACAKMSAQRKGVPRPKSPEAIEKLRRAWALRKAAMPPKPEKIKQPRQKHSPESIAKMKAVHKALWTDERRAEQSVRFLKWHEERRLLKLSEEGSK